jgi:hypothetical protein
VIGDWLGASFGSDPFPEFVGKSHATFDYL